MNLLAVVLIQGIHIQGVEMDIQQVLRKPFVAFDVLHDLLVFGAVQAEPSTFQQRNFTTVQRQRRKDKQRSLDSFRDDYVRPFLRDGASLGLTMDNRTRVKPLPFIQWLMANHFQPCQTALTAIEAVASEHTKLAPVVNTESPPEPVKSVPEPAAEIGQVKAIVVDTKPNWLAKAGDEWTETEVRRAFDEYKHMKVAGVKSYAAQTASLMGISRQAMNSLFERFGVKKPKKRGTWDI